MTVPTIPLLAGIQGLSFDQRKVWGRCPHCSAKHGEECTRVAGATEDLAGVHEERLSAAPYRVRIEVIP